MTGSVFNRGTAKRPNWAYSIYVGRDAEGKKRSLFKSGFSTKREADAACAEALRQHQVQQAAASAAPPDAGITVAEFLPRWFDDHAQRNCEKKTIERYRELANYFLPALGDVRIADLRPLMIERLMHQLHESGGRDKQGNPRPLSPTTVRSIAGVLSSVLNSARRWELIGSNPVEVIQLPKRQKKEQGVLDHAEFERLLDRARSSWIRPLLAVAGATGCRRGELLALQWADVDLDGGAVYISRSLEQTRAGLRIKSTKGRRARAFHLPGSAVAILRELREEQGREADRLGELYRRDLDLVFGDALGNYRNPGSVSAMAARMLQTAGFKGVSLHNLRHSHGSQLIDAGVPITDVSERLGHANPSITMSIYAHSLKSKQRDAADKWEEAAARARQQTRESA